MLKFSGSTHELPHQPLSDDLLFSMAQFSFIDRKRIVDANDGRDFGWHVLSIDDAPLATLTDCRWAEMFWDSYLVTPVGDHAETLTADFWYPDCHRLRSLEFPEIVVDVFGHFDAGSNSVTLRGGYHKVKFSWLDRLRSPVWFARHFWNHGVLS